MLLLFFAAFFSKMTFSKHSFGSTKRVSNSLDLGQDQCSIGPDLGPNCLPGFRAPDKRG